MIKKAFSLIEIAVTLVVLSIIIVGIVSVKELTKSSRLNSARQITIKSPVPQIEGLTIWLESTMRKSFKKSERYDKKPISTWVNISPEADYSNNALQSTPNKQPTYIAGSLNGLPVIRFDGNDDVLIGASSGISGSAGNSIFIVSRCSSLTSDQIVFSFGDSSSSTEGKLKHLDTRIGAGSGWGFNNGGRLFNEQLNINQYYISSWISPDTAQYNQHARYLNGTLSTQSSSSATTVPSIVDDEYIVGFGRTSSGTLSYKFSGDIAEIIVYNREISDLERRNIEEYLSAKWKIDLN